MEVVFNNLTEIVVMTTELADQNMDNIEVISSVILETALLLNQSSTEGTIEPVVIEMVSCHAHSRFVLKRNELYFIFMHAC